MKKIKTSELKFGDVLFYNRNSFISRAIKMFDGSDYSHSGIYFNGSVLEAVGSGVAKHPIAESIKDVIFVDVYRYMANDRGLIGDAKYPAQAIGDVIAKYEKEGDRYAYESILLFAMLCTTRKIHIPFVSWMVRNTLESALTVVNKIIAMGKQPMICSELVFRCFTEALPKDRYDIFITGADSMKEMPETLAAPKNKNFIATDEDISEINKLKSEFLAKMVQSKGIKSHDKSMKTLMKSLAVPDFVSPRDLCTSRNFVKIGRLE